MAAFNGLGLGMGNLSRLSPARSRSISPENFTGAPGKGGMATEGTGARPARDLGLGWKISPSIDIAAGENRPLALIDGPGAIQQIWATSAGGTWRNMILRVYWDDQEHPSIECPIGDFFACGWGSFAQVSSMAVCVNPGRAFNCYWEMPFRKRARFMLENRNEEQITLYYQISYTLTEVPEDCAYFHAMFRRTNPLPYKEDYLIVDGIEGQGHYVGTYLAWGVNNNGWWGEGEIKFFMDDDGDFPTICGTGTEDYFGGAYNFDIGNIEPGRPRAYTEFTTPYSGLPQVIRPDGTYRSQQRFGMYRWHLTDPVRSKSGSRSRSRRWAGGPASSGVICRSRMTSPRSPTGTRPCPAGRFHPWRMRTTCKSSEKVASPASGWASGLRPSGRNEPRGGRQIHAEDRPSHHHARSSARDQSRQRRHLRLCRPWRRQ